MNTEKKSHQEKKFGHTTKTNPGFGKTDTSRNLKKDEKKSTISTGSQKDTRTTYGRG